MHEVTTNGTCSISKNNKSLELNHLTLREITRNMSHNEFGPQTSNQRRIRAYEIREQAADYYNLGRADRLVSIAGLRPLL